MLSNFKISILIKLRNSKQKYKPSKFKFNKNPENFKINQPQHAHNTNTTCSKIQKHKQNISFNEINPNWTQKLFKENKSTSSKIQKSP